MTRIDDEWAEAPATPGTEPASPPDPSSDKNAGRGKRKGKKKKPAPKPVFQSLDEFVTEYLAQVIRRQLNGSTQTWCPAWWKHPEAISRLSALWRAWENLQLEPALGMSVWWLQHCDPHLRALMHPDTGPLASCSPEGHSDYAYKPLPLEKSDPALWLSPSFSTTPAPEAAPGTSNN
ncbi:DUF4913 domain-containing protein [Streptomyces sp. H10-C2]|uniref:DUF4913 domain-containing protein n=1 Tax=unclassified Streptomyces TaxID=2593676 RepID=UPI0024BBB6CA|nr:MULTISPECIES: DUF4913 domain-containing protein [unclassified Streptomyces]MDJ0344239.1 DUF4913 domain-containing protein [Streptomyces sp. PH10-H1]MDJ0373577.1 DUF4913 domain-containing protein [Streptomyces sp. H10-C2]